MLEITTSIIATQGHFDQVSNRIVSVATQGHFLFLVDAMLQSITITRHSGRITIDKLG